MGKSHEEVRYMKLEKWKKESENEIRIRGINTVDVPMWMINNYIKLTCDNYAKLVYLIKIVDIYSEQSNNIANIGISTESVPINEDGIGFENELVRVVQDPVPENGKDKYRLLNTSEKEEKDFWHFFKKCERPICFAITTDGSVEFLYNPRGEEGIKVRDISYHSPIDMGLGGVGAFIEHLVNAGTQIRNDNRLQEEHEARMVTQALETMEHSIDVLCMLNNSNLPSGHKEYLKNMYNGIMAKQEKLNEQIGVRRMGIDQRA